MSKERLYLFDTTLRDGAQTNGVDFTLEDKQVIAGMLDDLGIDYVEGGYPGANPLDTEFFAAKPKLKQARFTAFDSRTVARRVDFSAPRVSLAMSLVVLPLPRNRGCWFFLALVLSSSTARPLYWPQLGQTW